MSNVIVRTNLPDFRKQLSGVEARVQRKYAGRSGRAAGAILRELARSKAPILQPRKRADGSTGKMPRNRIAGLLRRAIGVRYNRRKSDKSTVTYTVGVASRIKLKGGGIGDPFYWYWQEAGWIPRGRGQKITGGNRTRALKRERLLQSGVKRVEGRFFLRNAAQQGQQAAIDAFFKRMDESFREENRR